jgi:hypothetical protein
LYADEDWCISAEGIITLFMGIFVVIADGVADWPSMKLPTTIPGPQLAHIYSESEVPLSVTFMVLQSSETVTELSPPVPF